MANLTSSRKKKIIAASVIFFSILISLFIYNWASYQVQFDECNDPNGCIRIYGNVIDEKFVPISDLQNDGTFTYIDSQEYKIVNAWTTEYNKSVAGVSLNNIFKTLEIIPDNATYIQFEAVDNFKSFKLPIEVVRNFPNQVLLINKEDGKILEPKSDGGEGPIKGFVSLPALQNNQNVTEVFAENGEDTVYNSVFNVKYLSAVRVY